jgi:putative transposon-encoded protein
MPFDMIVGCRILCKKATVPLAGHHITFFMNSALVEIPKKVYITAYVVEPIF